MTISSPRATRSSRREKWVFASKEPTASMRSRGLAGGLSRYADECWVVAAAVTGRAGTSGQRMPRRRRVRWLPDDRLGGRIAGQGVQVALHSSGRGLFTRERSPLPRWHPRGFDRVPCPPATLSRTAGERRAQHRPPRKRRGSTMLGSFRSNVTVGIAVLVGIAGLSYVLAASAAPPGGTTAAVECTLDGKMKRPEGYC